MDKAVITREASELGWRPGHYPLTVEVDGTQFTRQHACRDNDGDTMYVEYHPSRTEQYASQILRVFND